MAEIPRKILHGKKNCDKIDYNIIKWWTFIKLIGDFSKFRSQILEVRKINKKKVKVKRGFQPWASEREPRLKPFDQALQN